MKNYTNEIERLIINCSANTNKWILSYNDNVKPRFLQLLNSSNIDYEIFNTREQADNWLKKFR